MKKLVAIFLTVAMVLAMNISWAAPADMSGENGVIGEFTEADIATKQDNAVLIYKEITAYNKDGKTVNAPEITYNYAITPGSEEKVVKDAGGDLHATETSAQVKTKAGLPGATISGSVDGTNYVGGKLEFKNTVQLTTADNGHANTFPLKVDFSGVDWTGAGVYRYVITESVSTGAKEAAGITDGGISDTRYMDVYVKDAATAGEYEIYGFVCFKTNNDIDGTSTNSLNAAEKTEGFVTGNTDGSSSTDDDEKADMYYTFNLEISKTLRNDQAMNSHKFPFNVDFTNDSVTSKILLKQEPTTGGGITANLPAAAGVSSLDVNGTNLQLANGAAIKYVGIPVGVTSATTVAVKETNDVTGTTYTYTYKIDTADASAAASLNPGAESDVANLATITVNADDDVSHTIAFTNTLQLISPTGYVARIAPYVLMLAAGAILLILGFKRRTRKEEA